MALGRLLALGSRRLRALTVLGIALRELLAGRRRRAAALAVVAFLSWKFLAAAVVVELLRDRLRGDRSSREPMVAPGTDGGPTPGEQ